MKIKKYVEKKKIGGYICLGLAAAGAIDRLSEKPGALSYLLPLTSAVGVGLLISDQLDDHKDYMMILNANIDDCMVGIDDANDKLDEDCDDIRFSDLLDEFDEDDEDEDDFEMDTTEYTDEVIAKPSKGFKLENPHEEVEYMPPMESFWRDIEVDDDTPAPSSFVGTADDWEKVALCWKKYFIMLQRIQDSRKIEDEDNAEIEDGDNTEEDDDSRQAQLFNELKEAVTEEKVNENPEEEKKTDDFSEKVDSVFNDILKGNSASDAAPSSDN